MITPDEYERRIAFFPSNKFEDFNRFWKWKIEIESNSSVHILDEDHKKETYLKLCHILPAWKTYRNGKNPLWRETLKESLNNISETYNKLRNYTLLDFESIPLGTLEKAWHELGRVKEKEGMPNKNGCYSIISISKPLLLVWGQTPAFDSKVREQMPACFHLSKYCNWDMNEWVRIMRQFRTKLSSDENLLKFVQEESKKKYGEKATVPYGRFLDTFFWTSSRCPENTV